MFSCTDWKRNNPSLHHLPRQPLRNNDHSVFSTVFNIVMKLQKYDQDPEGEGEQKHKNNQQNLSPLGVTDG